MLQAAGPGEWAAISECEQRLLQGKGESDQCTFAWLNMGKISCESGVCNSYVLGAAGLSLML